MTELPRQLIVQREISALPSQFRRELGLAFPGRVEDEGLVLRVVDGETVLEITLEVGEPRAIGSICLPTLFVHLGFSGGSIEQQRGMLAHMDRAMQRGGG